MLQIRRSRARSPRKPTTRDDWLGSEEEQQEDEKPIQAVVETAGHAKKQKQQQQQQSGNGTHQRHQQTSKTPKKKTNKKQAIAAFFKRMKLRPLWRRSRSRTRSRSRGRSRRHSPGSGAEVGDEVDATAAATATAIVGSPGGLDLRPLPPRRRSLLTASSVGCFRLDPWGCPYDFAVQGDRVLVPGLDVAEFSLLGGRSSCRRWPVRLGRFAPLCIDATPGLVYLTAAGPAGCGLFVFDRGGRLAASRLAAPPDDYGNEEILQPRPSMFAVRVNFRGECWVTNPRDLSVDHYTAALRRIRSIDVARFGVPYYVSAHSHRLACLWVSFPETRRVVKFDWLTLEPLCHLAFGADQSPCGLHLDERGDQLYVTDIASCQLMVYHAGTMGLAGDSTRAANAAIAATAQRPAAIRLVGGHLLLLCCSAVDSCRIDVYAVAFSVDGD